MITALDRQSIEEAIQRPVTYRALAGPAYRPRAQRSRAYRGTPDDMGFIQALIAAATAALQVASQGGLFTDKKAGYKSADQQTDAIAATYGPDIITGAKNLGVDPNEVATALSYYLSEDKIILTPAQLLAAGHSNDIVGAITGNPMIYIGGAAATALLLFMILKRKH